MYGHEGAACTEPCIWCRKTDTEIQKDPATAEGGVSAPPRTHESIQHSFNEHVRLHDQKKGQAKLTGNIHRAPLISDDPSSVAPIALHIGLGLWCKFYELL